MRIGGFQLGLMFQQSEEIGERGFASFCMQPVIEAFDESEVVWRIHSKTRPLARERRVDGRMNDFDEVGMLLEIAGDVLARDGVVGNVVAELVKRAARKRI